CTSYQRALVQAELRKQRTMSAADYGWWKDRDIFTESDADRYWGDVRIVTIPERRIASDEHLVPFNGETIAELWREIAREVVGARDLPLSKLQQHQNVWAEARRSRNRGHQWTGVLAGA